MSYQLVKRFKSLWDVFCVRYLIHIDYVYVADANVSDRSTAGNCSGAVGYGEQQFAGDSDPPLPMCYTRPQPTDALWICHCNHGMDLLFNAHPDSVFKYLKLCHFSTDDGVNNVWELCKFKQNCQSLNT